MSAVNKYLWLVTDKNGKDVAQSVEAATAQEARTILTAEGYTNLRLQTDDYIAELSRGKEIEDLPPETQLSYLKTRKDGGIVRVFFNVLKDSGQTLALLALALGYAWYRHRMGWMILWGGCLVALLLHTFFYRIPSYLFAKLTHAREEHRWSDLLELTKQFEAMAKLTHVELKPSQVAHYRAMAMAGLGQLDEAVAYNTEMASHDAMPRWIIASQLAILNEIAKHHDQAVKLSEEAFALNPDSAAVVLDLAWRLIHRHKNAVRAQELITKAESMALPEVAAAYLLRTKGMIALRLQQSPLAVGLLEKALEIFEASNTMHYRESNIGLTSTYLTLAYAQAGQATLAGQTFKTAKRYLQQTQETELLQECAQAVGGHSLRH